MNVLGISSNTYNLLATNLDNSYSEISRVHFYCRLHAVIVIYKSASKLLKRLSKLKKRVSLVKKSMKNFPNP